MHRCHLAIVWFTAAGLLALVPSAAPLAAAQPASDAAAPTSKQVLERLDRDQDGFLTKDEMGERMAAAFGSIDTNGDGKASLEELDAVLKRVQNRQRAGSRAKGKASPAEAGRSTRSTPPQSTLHFQEAADYSAKDNGHAMLVMVDGEVVFERYDNGHTAETPHNLHSATKTFWGPVVAAMIEDKLVTSLDELASQTLTEWKSDPRKSKITVRQLLDLTAGLVQDIPNLQGDDRPTLAPDLYKHAVTLAADTDPGESFRYGPSCFYALGELMKRKLAPRKQTPLDYLKQRILDPVGTQVGDWIHDKSGNPHIPNGAFITAREWIKFGRLLVDAGRYEGRQIIEADLLTFKGSKANPGYGFTAWLNQPGGQGATPRQASKSNDKAGWIYPGGITDMYMAGGALGQRLYIIPSKQMVVVRFGETPTFSDRVFLGLLFDGKAPVVGPAKQSQ